MRSVDGVLAGWLLLMHPVFADQAYEELYRQYDFPEAPSPKDVPVCYGHGCATVARVALSDPQWQQVSTHLSAPAADPAAEREQVRNAIAEMERVVGELAGTSGDRAGDLSGFGTLQPQMDCVDESSNTTTYLTILEQAGLLRWHTVEPRAHRGFLIVGGWPHFTAVLRETGNGTRWTVDSWFRDNGAPPDVVDLETWKGGWRPAGFVF
ncbi:MAG: hypothetical protein H6953_11275 [Chromatiaceae bacterium]|nr:hypothetical protein [Gammaproteobacteria bacterium]MCP5306015.1 hypothetical protein [Chromatiaceae bacterium]MCP5316070.1 hypothetical protein [Chromatiaceae bacterium]